MEFGCGGVLERGHSHSSARPPRAVRVGWSAACCRAARRGPHSGAHAGQPSPLTGRGSSSGAQPACALAALAAPAAPTTTSSSSSTTTTSPSPSSSGGSTCVHSLQSLLPGASHTSINLCSCSVDLYGNYAVRGPASITKVNGALFAVVHPGGSIAVLAADGPGGACAELSQDATTAAATANLLGGLVELCGPCLLVGAQARSATCLHDDKLVLHVARLTESSTILLLPGGTLSHPVVVSPHPQR